LKNRFAKEYPLKIALICDWYLPRIGGIEMHLQELAERLTRRGHTVHVITSFPESGPTIFPTGSFRVIRLSVPLLPRFRIMISLRGVCALESLFRKEKYDLVHSHFSYISPVALAGLYAAHRLDIPGIITFHSFLKGIVRVLQGLDRLTGWGGWPSAFTAVSREVARDVQALLFEKPVSLLPNGVDPAVWSPRPRKPEKGGIRLVSVMRLTRKKRGAALVRMFHALKKQVPAGNSLELLIIGDGHEYATISRMISRRGLAGQIRLMGFQPPAVIRQIFAGSDLFVLPSFLESFGIAALEARCSGLPVVAMSHGGVKTFISDGVDGFLADNDTHMETILAGIIRNPSVLHCIRSHNITTPCPFTWDRGIDEHEHLYRSVVCLKHRRVRSTD
jgi:glycosyltransferase involved in cell wall biosynthesis